MLERDIRSFLESLASKQVSRSILQLNDGQNLPMPSVDMANMFEYEKNGVWLPFAGLDQGVLRKSLMEGVESCIVRNGTATVNFKTLTVEIAEPPAVPTIMAVRVNADEHSFSQVGDFIDLEVNDYFDLMVLIALRFIRGEIRQIAAPTDELFSQNSIIRSRATGPCSVTPRISSLFGSQDAQGKGYLPYATN